MSADRTARVDLGLQLLSIARRPGTTFTLQEIAVWCGCGREAVRIIEQRALMKLHHRLRFGRHRQVWKELVA